MLKKRPIRADVIGAFTSFLLENPAQPAPGMAIVGRDQLFNAR
jgi:hypothetical protein